MLLVTSVSLVLGTAASPPAPAATASATGTAASATATADFATATAASATACLRQSQRACFLPERTVVDVGMPETMSTHITTSIVSKQGVELKSGDGSPVGAGPEIESRVRGWAKSRIKGWAKGRVRQ